MARSSEKDSACPAWSRLSTSPPGCSSSSFSALFVARGEFRPAHNKRRMLLAMAALGAGLMLMTLRPAGLSFGFRVVHEIGDGALGVFISVFISRLFARKSIGGSAGAGPIDPGPGPDGRAASLLAPLGFRYGLEIPFLDRRRAS